MPVFRIALTGGIASGKSTVAAMFRELGMPVIDLDQVARDVVRPGTAGLEKLKHAFGEDIVDDSGALRRDQLRKLIFSDAKARQEVNSILHPLILTETEQRLDALQAPYAIVEIPLLTETDLARQYQRVLVVDVPEQTQIERLKARDGVTETEARASLRAQATRDERLAIATEIIANTSTLDELQAQVKTLHKQYLEEAKRFASAAKRPAE